MATYDMAEVLASTSLHGALLGCFACPFPWPPQPALPLGHALLLTCPATGCTAVAQLRAAKEGAAGAAVGLDIALTLWGEAGVGAGGAAGAAGAAGARVVRVRALGAEELPPPGSGAAALRAHPLGLIPGAHCTGSPSPIVSADALDDGVHAWDGWGCSVAGRPAPWLAPMPWGSERLTPAQCALLAALLHNRLLAPQQCVCAPVLGAAHLACEGSLEGWCVLRVQGSSGSPASPALQRISATQTALASMPRPPPHPPLPPLPSYAAWHSAAAALAPGQGEALARMLRPAAAARQAGASLGMLLVGPPGVGKSRCAEAAALASHCPAFRLSSPALFSSELGGSEARVLRLAAAARAAARTHGQAWVLLEDAEALLPAAPRSALAVRCRDLLLSAMDEGEGEAGAAAGSIVWCALSNRPGALCPAALGPTRLHCLVQLGLPSAEQRLQQLAACLREGGAGAGGSGAAAGHLAETVAAAAHATHGFSCADLSRLVCAALSGPPPPLAPTPAAALDLASPWAPALRCVRPSLLAHATGTAPRPISLATLYPTPALKAAVSAVLLPLLYASRYAALHAAPAATPPTTTTAAASAAPRGLLITGPPGTGKSTLAHALGHAFSGQYGAGNALVLTGPDLVSPLVGATEAALARAFASARQLSPCLLIIDQFEALAPPRCRTGGARHSDRLLSVLLTEMDGVASGSAHVCLVAVCSEEGQLDGAVLRPGRLECRARTAAPGVGERRALLVGAGGLAGLLSGGSEGSAGGSGVQQQQQQLLERAVAATEGMTQAQVVEVARAASWNALRRAVEEQEQQHRVQVGAGLAPSATLCAADLERALSAVQQPLA